MAQGEYSGMTIRGGHPDACWLPSEWTSGMTREFTSEELTLWRTRCAHRRLEYKREFTRDQRPPYLVRLEAL